MTREEKLKKEALNHSKGCDCRLCEMLNLIQEGRALQRQEDREMLDAAGIDLSEAQAEVTALKEQISKMQMTEEEARQLHLIAEDNYPYEFVEYLKQKGLIKEAK